MKNLIQRFIALFSSKAQKENNKSIDQPPNGDTEHGYYDRGNARYRLADYRGAIADFTTAIEFNPRDADAFNNRGLAKTHLDDLRGAIADYTKAIEIDAEHANAYYNRSQIKFKLQDFNGTISDLNKIIEINKKVKNYEPMPFLFNEKLEPKPNPFIKPKLFPNLSDVYYDRGVARGKLGNIEGSILDYSIAIEIDPKHANAYFNRGNARGRLGDYSDAILDYTKVIEINPKDAEAYFSRGGAKLLTGDRTGACKDWRMAGEMRHGEALKALKEYCK